MGNKVDYRPKKNKKIIKYVKVFCIVILVIIIGYFIVQSILRAYRSTVIPNSSNVEFHYDVEDYESLQDILNSHNCVYISETRTSNLLKVYLKFDRDVYTDNVSNERYFDNLIRVIAQFENYINFELIDESRDIDILVTCEDSNIVQIEINGDNNYYLNQDSLINASKDSAQITDFTIDSNILLTLIDNDWNPTGLDIGTEDSTCNKYEIYFDEGFKYVVAGRTIYNLIFTEKYTGDIISGLNASSTAEDVENTLGEPTFKTGSMLYGYLGEQNYVFFDFMNNQVSIYPVISMNNEEEFIELINEMNESIDIRQFSMDLISLWSDYDIYDYDSNYVDLKYTLRGIELTVSSNSLKNGIYIYQNYPGDINALSQLDNVYIQSTDSVFDEESKRCINENLMRNVEGEFTEEELAEMGTKFSVYFRGVLASNETGYKGPTFYSRDEEYPDTELESTLVISSYKWYDEYNFIYSVDDDGIYLFNPVSNSNIKIMDIEGEINIDYAENGKIVYNNNQEINVDIR